MKTLNTDTITSDDLRAERTWLLQHGMHEKTTIGGRSFLAAARELQAEIEELSKQIDKMEGRA